MRANLQGAEVQVVLASCLCEMLQEHFQTMESIVEGVEEEWQWDFWQIQIIKKWQGVEPTVELCRLRQSEEKILTNQLGALCLIGVRAYQVEQRS